jgi:hypothetical protein
VVRRPKGIGRRLSKRLPVDRSESSKLVEPVVGGGVRDRGRLTALVGQGAPDTLKPHAHDPSFRAHAPHAIERVAKPSLAQPDESAEHG